MSLHPPREGSRDTGKGIIVSNFPDYCRSPNAIIPYTIVARQNQMAANTAATVKMTGQRAHKQTSIITSCTGDEAGTGLGIKSNTILSVCHRKDHSKTVRIEGEWATRHGDEWWMNNRNTTGKLVWPEHNLSYTPTPPIQYAFLDTATTGTETMTDAGPAPELAPPTQLPSGPTSSQPPAPPPEAPAKSAPPGGNRWWSGASLPKLGGGPAGPGAMNAMAVADWWLKQNVNRPDEWFQKGLVRQRAPSQPHAGPNLLDQLGGVPTVKTDAPPDPHARTKDNVSNKGERKRRCGCIVGAYKTIRSRCGPECGSTFQAHHIIPDYTLRYGTRKEAEAGQKRISGLPSFYDGPAICLEGQANDAGSEHGLAHEADAAVARQGSGSSNPQGTADIHSITRISEAAANNATKFECATEIGKGLAAQPSLQPTILGRTTISPPVEGDGAYEALSNGQLATKH